MADIKFNPNLPVHYGEVVKAERPRSTGLTLVPINRYSGRAVVDTDVAYYGNKPGDVIERLFKDGIPAQGFINNKFYRDGQELSAEQIQAQTIENVIDITGPLATLGLREARGIAGEKFVRDAEAEKRYAELVRKSGRDYLAKKGNLTIPGFAYIASADSMSPEKYANYLINLSDEEIIANVGGVNKENITASRFGINATMGYPAGVAFTEYVQGSRVIDIPDILALAKISSNPGDPQQGNATKQLISIFENDSSFKRREQARDALSYGLPGYTGSPGGAKGVYGADRPSGTNSQGINTSTDPATMALIQSLQSQITSLSASNQQAAMDKAAEVAAAKKEKAESAIAVLTDRFSRYGLASLVPKIKELAIGGAGESTITLQLQETEEYQQRFRANKERIKKGLAVLDPATYIGLEDKYRQVLKSYGLKQFDNDDYVTQFLENNTSVDEVASRISLAVDRVKFADPMILETLRTYYPNINDTDLVAYMLDPKNEEPKLMRQVQTAEVTAAARMQGLTPGKQYAEELVGKGVTKQMAQKGYATIADILPTAEKLSDIYGTTLPGYRQTQAEDEEFTKLASAKRKRIALIEREIAEFGGQSGVGRGSLGKQTGGTY
jgi:hypothetical protein